MATGTKVFFNVIRQAVIAYIAERLHELQQNGKKVSQPIINMYGIAGIGKTYTVRQLYEHFGEHYNVVWLGFDRAEFDRTRPEEKQYIQPLAKALALLEQLPTLRGQLDAPPDQEINVFIRATSIEMRPLLLLLDALDDLPIWKWVQEAIIKPLCEQQNSIIICTSQSPLFWDYWELRDWCEEYPLEVFNREEMTEYLEQRGLTNIQRLLDTVHDYTLGYPLAVSNLTEEIAKADTENDDSSINLEELNLSDNEWRLLGYIGVMRLAEIDVMRKLLDRMSDRAGHALPSLMDLTTLLKKLQVAKLLRTTRPDLPLQLAVELRRATKAWIEREAPGRYQTLCENLEQIYYALAINKPKTAVHACVEWLYFSSELPLESPDDRKHWLNKLQYCLNRAIEVNKEVIRDVRTPDLVTADASLVVLIYRDQELIKNLNRLRLFNDVDNAILQFLNAIQGTLQECWPNVDMESKELTALRLRFDFNRSCSTVLESLSNRLPIETLPSSMQDKLDFTVSILNLTKPDEVNVDQLRKLISHSAMYLSPQQLNDILSVFNSRGLLSYNRSRRTYQFHPIIKHLVQKTSSPDIGQNPH